MLSALVGKDLLRTTLLIIFLVALAYFFPYMPLFLLLVLLAGLLAISLHDGAILLEKVCRIPQKWGVIIALSASIIVIAGVVVVLSAPFYGSLRSFLASLPGDLESSRPYFTSLLESPLGRSPIVSVDFFSTVADWFSENAAIIDLNLPALFPPVGTLIWQLLGAMIIIMVIIATGVYIAMTPISLLNAFLRLFSSDNRWRAQKVLSDLYEGLHVWPIATILSIFAVGAMTSTTYWVIGLPSALLLGVVAGLLQIIPYFGAVIAAIPTVIVAANQSAALALITLVTIIVVQIINRNVIVPAIMSRVVHVHPAVIALSIVPIYWIFGLLGVFLVVPICVTCKVLIRDLWIERPTRRRNERKSALLTPDSDLDEFQDGQQDPEKLQRPLRNRG